jgi:hypothetical protein
MTVLANTKSITPTAKAKSVVQTHGAQLGDLLTLFQQHASEVQILLKLIIALHPSTGGDAANYAALSSLLAELT